MRIRQLKVGETIPYGELVLLTEGHGSSFSVIGMFWANTDVIVPSRHDRRESSGDAVEHRVIDNDTLSLLLIKVNYVEAWTP